MTMYRFATVAAAFLLIGCATAPDFRFSRLRYKVPDGWAEHAAAKPLPDSDWVKSFHDKRLVEVVNEARGKNRDLMAASARINSAHASAVIAGADLKPQVTGQFDAIRSKRNNTGFGFGGGTGTTTATTTNGASSDTSSSTDTASSDTTSSASEPEVTSAISNTFDLDLNVRWELDIWGRVRAGQSAALAELQASQADYEAARLSVSGQTAKAWFALLSAMEQEALAKRAHVIFEKTQETIRDEFIHGVDRAGRDIAAELQLAMSDVQTAQADVARRAGELLGARRVIEVLLGRYPSGELKATHGLPKAPPAPPAGIPAQVLERRPDLLAAERRLAAADKRILEAKRSLLPAIALTGSLGTSSPELSDILNGDFVVWNIANSLSQPILDGQRLRQTVKLRESDLEAALADYEQTVLEAFREVENSLAQDRFLARQEASLAKAAKLAQEALDRSRESYADGLSDVLTLLDAQRRLINIETSLIDVRRQRLDNRVDLHLALGGSFGSPQDRLQANL